MTSEPVIIEKQMGITHAEFLRLLPQGLDSDSFVVTGRGAGTTVTDSFANDQKIEIVLGEESVRQIALMRIPTTPVKLTLDGFNDLERDAFMLTFDRAYQRGGG